MSQHSLSLREPQHQKSEQMHPSQEDSEWTALGHEDSDSVIFGSHGSSSLLAGTVRPQTPQQQQPPQPPLRRVYGHRNLSSLVPRSPTLIPRAVSPLRPRAGTVPTTRSSTSSGLLILGPLVKRAQIQNPRRERNIFAPSSNGSSQQLASSSLQRPSGPENRRAVVPSASGDRAVSADPTPSTSNARPVRSNNYDWLEYDREPAQPLCLLGMSVPVLPPQIVLPTRAPEFEYDYNPEQFQGYLSPGNMARILAWLENIIPCPPPGPDSHFLSPDPRQQAHRSSSRRLRQHVDNIHHPAVLITPPSFQEIQRTQMQPYMQYNAPFHPLPHANHPPRHNDYDRQRQERERQIQHFEWLDRQARLRRELEERDRVAEAARGRVAGAGAIVSAGVSTAQMQMQVRMEVGMTNLSVEEQIREAMDDGSDDDQAIGVPGRPYVKDESFWRRVFRSL
ncbi:hypothetical protein BZA77DRAFT_297320 [Pyronema omphalodes]|nr:hypothetical protein BZA77DRAFT_297320 [Pyronema omphalodes]